MKKPEKILLPKQHDNASLIAALFMLILVGCSERELQSLVKSAQAFRQLL